MSATYGAGSTGGEASHKLTASEMPSHTHSVDKQYVKIDGQNDYMNKGNTGSLGGYCIADTDGAGNGQWSANNGKYRIKIDAFTTKATGSGSSHNNMPPYLSVYVWKRTA